MKKAIPQLLCFLTILFAFLAPALGQTTKEDDIRAWTNMQGKAMEADFIKIDGLNVIFERSGGKRFNYPLSSLNEASQKKAKEFAVIFRFHPSIRARCAKSWRAKALKNEGGSVQTDEAVHKGLSWLAQNQNQDGSWGTDYKCAMTGVALLAFLGHCETTHSPKYGDVVAKAGLYLMDRGLKNKGKLWEPSLSKGKAYTHGIATYALAELYTCTIDCGREIPQLEAVISKAAKVIVDGQDKRGGWNYWYRNAETSDLSVGGFQFQALKALHNTGRKFPGVEKALDKAVEYIKDTQDLQGAFKYNTKDDKGKKSMTAVGMLALQLWHQEDSKESKMAMGYLRKAYAATRLSPSAKINYYQEYYASQVFFLSGGFDWEKYNMNFLKKISAAQNADGSWSKPNEGNGDGDSQILATCMATMSLEIFYRHPRARRKPVSRRP